MSAEPGYRPRTTVRKPGIRTVKKVCYTCEGLTEWRVYARGLTCLPCAARRERERRADPTPRATRGKIVSEYELARGEVVCPGCFLTVCDCG